MILAKHGTLAGHRVRVVQGALQEISRRPLQTREGFVEQEKRKARLRSKAEINAAGEAAGTLWDALAEEGLLVRNRKAQPDAFRPSKRAMSILATIGTGHKRQAATKALHGFVERCRHLDSRTSIYPYRVETAIAFGAYATGKETVGEVDVLVKLKPRRRSPMDWQRYVVQQEMRGRSLPRGMDPFGPYPETLTFLKGRSRILSLITELDEHHLELVLQGPHQLVYGKL